MPLSLTRRSFGFASLAACPLPNMSPDRPIAQARITHKGRITHETLILSHSGLTRTPRTLAHTTLAMISPPDNAPKLRFLCGDTVTAWMFDDQRDHLSTWTRHENRLTQQSGSVWLSGHRLQSAGITPDGSTLIGWDNRHAVLIALNPNDGRILARMPVTAEHVTFG